MLNQLRIKHYSHEVELTLFLPDDTTKGVAEHSFRLQPSINLHIYMSQLQVQLLWYPLYYPVRMKARV